MTKYTDVSDDGIAGDTRDTGARPFGAVGRALMAVAAAILVAGVGSAAAQQAVVTGQVVAGDSGEPIPGATLRVGDAELGAVAREEGRFRIGAVPAGEYRVTASAVGYRTASRDVAVERGSRVELRFELEPRPVEMQGIQVSVLRPDLEPQARLEAEKIRLENPKDSGELLRSLPGVSGVRRGPLGVDPSVRGLRETEVGTYLDGTRMFPAGPARMDSPLTHLDPSAISDIEVVKGPYALTLGAGNLSAVRVTTRSLPSRGREGLRGRVSSGYDANLNAAETTGHLSGRRGPISYRALGAWRQGNDYESGDGTVIPGDYESAEGRGKIGVDVSESSKVVLGGGYQDQGAIDYPGRLLNAELFHTLNLNGRWELDRSEGALRDLAVMGYVNDVEHAMNNDGKPTSRPMEGRMPPFALDVRVDAGVNVWGGRVNSKWAAGDAWRFETGGDVYSATRNAVRTIRRDSDDTLLFEDLMWPDATITDAGGYGRVTRRFGDDVRLSGTARVDRVRAEADTASAFFRQNTTGSLEQDETSASGALTLGYDLGRHWTVSVGAGSAVRTADATERYSDRIPATKAQTSAEFMGNPDLAPERSNQADLWLEASYPGLALQLNVFARHMDDYITIEATDLPKRLPLSPETVFRYVNGEAEFWGFEASADVGVTESLTLSASTNYLRGRNLTRDRPVIGIAPMRGSLGARFEPRQGRFFVQTDVAGVADQERVARELGEGITDGYVTADLRGGVRVYRGLRLRLGVENLADEQYVNHLNAKNPFTGTRIPEPGRVFFADLSWAFGPIR